MYPALPLRGISRNYNRSIPMRFFIAVITMCLAAALNPALARQHPANSYMQPFAIEASILGNVEKPRRTSLRAHK